MDKKHVKLIVTLGPSTNTEQGLRKIKDKGADFVRINMSHSTLEDLEYFIDLSQKVDIPFIIDTEGSQIRTGEVASESGIKIDEAEEITLFSRPVAENRGVHLRPEGVIGRLKPGDLVYIDFDALVLRISDTSTADSGFIKARALTSGKIKSNKAVAVDSAFTSFADLPALSEKDIQSIKLGLEKEVNHLAVSFVRSGDFVEQAREASENKMKIISKVECIDALENIDEIIEKSDYLLLDRGDLSKEIPIEKIPMAQKTIIKRAKEAGKGVFIATNFLESMVQNPRPTRAEVCDAVNAVLDGAYGLVLSAETAIGKYPMKALNMMNQLISEAGVAGSDPFSPSSVLIPPHGGKLVNRVLRNLPEPSYLASLPKVVLDDSLQMDVEQIGIGTFSPLEGFMNKQELISVLENMRLPSGHVWPLPIVLDVSEEDAEKISAGGEAVLTDGKGEVMAVLRVEDKYHFDKDEMAEKLYGTLNQEHPGVVAVKKMKPIFLGGKIDLLKRRPAEFKEYELTPQQVRRLFEERCWSRVVGFHTRNVIHRGHEYIQMSALARGLCDGLFVHPVVGKKKVGDYRAKHIIGSYEMMVKKFYPKDSAVLGTFATYSRYAGPREALFTAICRQNFGCSHFVVGRDHTGVKDFYHPTASHEIFAKFPDLLIKPITFNKVYYSKKRERHVHEPEAPNHPEDDKFHISGTAARKMFERGETPPAWYMRPEISSMVAGAIKRGEEVFVRDEQNQKNGQVLWFTGLSGSGKSTIAEALERQLTAAGKKTVMLDGDSIRQTAHQHLDFSREGVRENNRLIAELAAKKAEDADFVLVSVISPYAEDRESNRKIIGKGYIEVYVSCPVEICEARDTKGLYKKARAGEIKTLIGFHESSPYEEPQNPDIKIESDILSVEESIGRIVKFLKFKGLV